MGNHGDETTFRCGRNGKCRGGVRDEVCETQRDGDLATVNREELLADLATDLCETVCFSLQLWPMYWRRLFVIYSVAERVIVSRENDSYRPIEYIAVYAVSKFCFVKTLSEGRQLCGSLPPGIPRRLASVGSLVIFARAARDTKTWFFFAADIVLITQ